MSASTAYWIGQLTVNVPVMLVMIGLPLGLALLLRWRLGLSSNLSAGIGLGAFVVCWFLAWLTWSVLIPRWRLWAYERVDDIDELESLAIGSLTWPDEHKFTRTEIWSRRQRERYRAILQSRGRT